jgi:hypothetical protein
MHATACHAPVLMVLAHAAILDPIILRKHTLVLASMVEYLWMNVRPKNSYWLVFDDY